jgi:hypothetical protein
MIPGSDGIISLRYEWKTLLVRNQVMSGENDINTAD